MLPRDDEDARSILWACFGLAGCATLVVCLVTYFFGRTSFAALGAPYLYRYWWMLPATILGGALYQCLSVWALRRKDYVTLTGTKLRQTLVGSLVNIGVGSLWKGPLGLLLGSFCSTTMGVGRLGRGTLFQGREVGNAVLARRVVGALREYGRFAVMTTGSTFLNSAGPLIGPMLLSTFYGQAVVGHFSLAQRIISLPGSLVGIAVGQVFFAEASEIIRERPEELLHLFKKITRKMVPVAVVVVLFGAACPWVFPVVFGARWHAAGIFAAILSLLAATQLLVGSIAEISVLRQRQGLQFSLGVFRTMIVFASIWLPFRFGFGPLSAVGCYTLGMSSTWAVAYLFYARIARESHTFAHPVPLTSAA
jgi:O-antigen/teichoic acid export membrane protein